MVEAKAFENSPNISDNILIKATLVVKELRTQE
jgi:hypothetical protein